MTNEATTTCQVENILLGPSVEKEVGRATVRVGGITIRGVKIWASKSGKARVFFPSVQQQGSWVDAIEFPPEIRSDIESKVIAAYEEAKAQAAEKAEQQQLKSSTRSKGQG